MPTKAVASADIDGRVVFVRFALPGELVRVVLDEPHDREDRFSVLAK